MVEKSIRFDLPDGGKKLPGPYIFYRNYRFRNVGQKAKNSAINEAFASEW